MNDFIVKFGEIADAVSGFLWGWPMMILLFGTHIYLTVLLRFPQLQIFKAIKMSFQKDHDAAGDVSMFGSLATSLAGTIGTGNIIGVATAITMGGPGAVFWCWMTGVMGFSTKYAESLLGLKFRQRSADGRMQGGPMYALEKGLGLKWLAVLFCVFTVLASFGIGNTVQANAISVLLEDAYNVPLWVSGLIVAVLVALVILKGIKGISSVCTALVPFMAGLYILGCLVILVMNSEYVVPAISMIVKSAFDPQAAAGGFVGGSVLLACRYGVARGLFSNESGLGSAPIVAAAAKTRNSVRQAMVASTANFWDTVVICALTGIVLVSSILAGHASYDDGATLTKAAFSIIPVVGTPILTIGIATFAFTTILGWTYCAERSLEYLAGYKLIKPFRVIWCICIFVGAIVNLSLVWSLADSMNALMAVPNLVSLLLLSSVIVKETRKYLWEKRLDDFDPDLMQ